MTHHTRLFWMARWSAPVGWFGAAILFGLWVDRGAFAWWIGPCALVAILSHLAILHHAHSSKGDCFRDSHKPRRLPPWRNLTFLTIVVLTSPAWAQVSTSTTPKEDQRESYTGSDLFKTYCASCHGIAAKGDGPLANHLGFRPSDLTLLARRNKGKWDSDKVKRTIDGRDPLKGHGGTDMPVWGDAFKNSREGYSEDAVGERIRALVDYLHSLQATPERDAADPARKEP